MPELSVTRRYAQALFDTAQRGGTVEKIEQDLDTIDAALRSTPLLMRVLRAPTIGRDRKKEVLRQVFGSGVTSLTMRFLYLLVEKRREAILPYINTEFKQLSYRFRNILPVTVRVATRLTAEERQRLTQVLAAKTGQTIDLHEEVDPSLMGGAVLRLGDTIIDGSVTGYLRRLRQRMLAGAGV
jgi:F-type H+-transporting ATPase subunit delta